MTNDQRLHEAQSYQSIGEPSAELAAINQEPRGVQGSPAGDLSQMQSDHDYSFWNKRANLQALSTDGDASYAEAFFNPGAASGVPSIAAHTEEPTAGYGAPSSGPFKGYSEDGIIDGATASTETPASPSSR